MKQRGSWDWHASALALLGIVLGAGALFLIVIEIFHSLELAFLPR